MIASKGRLALVLCVLLATTCVTTQRNVPLAGTGWVAKRLCSGLFVAGREMAEIVEAELPIPVPLPIRHAIDPAARRVTSEVPGGFAQSVAQYRPGLGCTLDDPAGQASALDAIVFPEPFHPLRPLRVAAKNAALDEAIATAFDSEDEAGHGTRAVVVFQDGALAGERYAAGFDTRTPLTGWSITKSVTSALVGILVREGRIDANRPVGLARWNTPGDPRAEITWDQLLRMSSGLAFLELYLWPASDATQMLFGAARGDRGGYAGSRALESPVDAHWSYSSGTTNLLHRALLERVFGGNLEAYLRFPHDALFGPLGMASAVFEPDASGVYVGSSHLFATPRDWARFGQLYLDEGRVGERTILPREWITYTRTPTPTEVGGRYGAHWWLNADPADGRPRRWPSLEADLLVASGHEGQYLVVVPSKSAVIVRFGYDPFGGFPIESFVAEVLASLDAD